MCRALVAILLVVVIVATAVTSNKLRCVHGELESDRCVCEDNYIGQRCNRQMHCSTFMRNFNGTCIACELGWTGPFCDSIVCHTEYGTPTKDLLMCECIEPAIGSHCTNLTTSNIYLHYNRRMAEFWGPLGAIVIIPMIACFVLCERASEKRQEKRIERVMADMKEAAGDQQVEQLLDREPKGP
uniref:EGF-like domain-containing protein n=1 Tax=Plectus sambesii TaxID=2011161 RepID=A0A914VVV9_9BILA